MISRHEYAAVNKRRVAYSRLYPQCLQVARAVLHHVGFQLHTRRLATMYLHAAAAMDIRGAKCLEARLCVT